MKRCVTGLLLLLGCREAPLARSPAELAVFPEQLTFEARVGHSQRQTFEVRNTSRVTQLVHLSVDAPFTVEPGDFPLAGGATVQVAVLYSPRTVGSSSALLQPGSQTVSLEGLAREACPPPGACHQLVDDDCSEVPGPDGARCVTACIGEGQCVAGECVGTSRPCDDGDPCTLDLCDGQAGCRHQPVACTAADDPCQAAFCDSTRGGCQASVVADGTACGEADCTTSHVCIAGACTTRPTPDGVACGADSPCQDRGSCSAGQCHRPAPRPLVEAWSYTPPWGDYWAFDFPGVVDAQGNLFWWEGQPNDPSKKLVSVTRDGVVRFRTQMDLVPLTASFPGDLPGVLMLDGDLIILAENSTFFASTLSRLEARRALDGSLAWSHDLLAEIRAVAPCTPAGWTGAFLGAPVDDGAGGLYLKLERYCGNGVSDGSLLVSLDAATGATRWSRFDAFMGRELISDVEGNAYFLTALDQLTSVDRFGHQRWSRAINAGGLTGPHVRAGSPLAVFANKLIQGNHDVIDLAGNASWSGSSLGRPATVNAQLGVTPLMGPGFVGLFTELGALTYSAYDLATGTRRWVVGFPGSISSVGQPVLTSTGSTLISFSRAGASGVTLEEISKDGVELWSCELPLTGDFLTAPTLRNGHYTVASRTWTASSVKSFVLPGAEPALHGWVTAAGKMSKQGHAR